MSSITGLKKGSFTSVNNSGEFRLGTNLDSGTAGEVIVSGGVNQPVAWGANGVAVPNPLTMGANVNLSSGNPSWDGSVADTINSVDTDTTYSAANGIEFIGTTIWTKNDLITINNIGAGNTNQVLRVPNSLTAGTNISYSVGTTYDGSAAITINSTDTDTTYQAGDGIEIDTTTNPDTIKAKVDGDTIDFDGDELACLKVPEGLSAGDNLSFTSGATFDGDTARTINVDKTLLDMTSIFFNGTGTPTYIQGSNYYMGTGTICYYLDLTSPTNHITPPNVFEVAGDLRMTIDCGGFLPNDDSSYFNIGVEDDLSSNIHGTIRPLTSSLEVCGYFTIPANYTATAVRIDVNNSSGISLGRTITCESITTYGGLGFTSLGTFTAGSEQTLTTTMPAASDKQMLIKIYTTSTTDHIRGGYIKLTRN